jgi:hypothetical protein
MASSQELLAMTATDMGQFRVETFIFGRRPNLDCFALLAMTVAAPAAAPGYQMSVTHGRSPQHAENPAYFQNSHHERRARD